MEKLNPKNTDQSMRQLQSQVGKRLNAQGQQINQPRLAQGRLSEAIPLKKRGAIKRVKSKTISRFMGPFLSSVGAAGGLIYLLG